MMATENIATTLQDLRTRIDGIAAALVSRNGLVLSADLPQTLHSETFSIMCATIFGAATTANGELSLSKPERIVIEGRDSKVILVGSGEDALLVAMVGGSRDGETTSAEMAKFADLFHAARRNRTP